MEMTSQDRIQTISKIWNKNKSCSFIFLLLRKYVWFGYFQPGASVEHYVHKIEALLNNFDKLNIKLNRIFEHLIQGKFYVQVPIQIVRLISELLEKREKNGHKISRLAVKYSHHSVNDFLLWQCQYIRMS